MEKHQQFWSNFESIKKSSIDDQLLDLEKLVNAQENLNNKPEKMLWMKESRDLILSKIATLEQQKAIDTIDDRLRLQDLKSNMSADIADEDNTMKDDFLTP